MFHFYASQCQQTPYAFGSSAQVYLRHGTGKGLGLPVPIRKLRVLSIFTKFFLFLINGVSVNKKTKKANFPAGLERDKNDYS